MCNGRWNGKRSYLLRLSSSSHFREPSALTPARFLLVFLFLAFTAPAAGALPFYPELQATAGYRGFGGIPFSRNDVVGEDQTLFGLPVVGARWHFGLSLIGLRASYTHGLTSNFQRIDLGLELHLRVPLNWSLLVFRAGGGGTYYEVPMDLLPSTASAATYELGLQVYSEAEARWRVVDGVYVGLLLRLGFQSGAQGLGLDWAACGTLQFVLDRTPKI